MSGSRALASARRRRAEPQATSSTSAPTSLSAGTNNNMTSIREENVSQERPKMSPAMMLLSHNKIIENLQTVIESLNAKIEQQENDMKKLIEDSMNNSKIDDSNLEYYKNKIVAIDNSLEEIKKHTLKVQTFSMETNLQLVEVKKRLNKYEKKEQDNQEKQRDQIIEHINTVSTILTKINYEVEQSKEAQNIQNNTLVDILEGINNNITSENVIEEEEPVDEQEEEPVDEQQHEEPVDEQQEEPVDEQQEEEPVDEQQEEEPVDEQQEEEPVDELDEPINLEGEQSTKLKF